MADDKLIKLRKIEHSLRNIASEWGDVSESGTEIVDGNTCTVYVKIKPIELEEEEEVRDLSKLRFTMLKCKFLSTVYSITLVSKAEKKPVVAVKIKGDAIAIHIVFYGRVL